MLSPLDPGRESGCIVANLDNRFSTRSNSLQSFFPLPFINISLISTKALYGDMVG
jgi:hypothetical protein